MVSTKSYMPQSIFYTLVSNVNPEAPQGNHNIHFGKMTGILYVLCFDILMFLTFCTKNPLFLNLIL